MPLIILQNWMIINIPSSSGFDFDGNDAISLYFNNEIIERFGIYLVGDQGSFNFSGGSWLFGENVGGRHVG